MWQIKQNKKDNLEYTPDKNLRDSNCKNNRVR